jgi:nucleoside-diphosphate-sugar epimerase
MLGSSGSARAADLKTPHAVQHGRRFMKVLALGGTGSIGAHLVDDLVSRGHHVTVTSRSKQTPLGGAKYVLGDAQEISFVDEVLKSGQWDVILDFMVYSTARFQERVSTLLGSTDQYVFFSTARVYADSPDRITEESPRLLDCCTDQRYLSSDEYALTKARQEDLLRASGHRNWTILRPYITYADERLQLGTLEKEAWLFRALQGKSIIFCKDLADKVTTMTHGLDVARATGQLIGESKALGEAFTVASERTITWKRVLEVYLDVLKRKQDLVPDVLQLDAASFSLVTNRDQLYFDRLFNRTFDCQKISQFVDIESFTEPEHGLRQCCEEFLRSPNFRHINWKSEARKDRLANERTPLTAIPKLRQKINYLVHRNISN